MTTEKVLTPQGGETKGRSGHRVVAIVFLLFVAGYTAAVLAGLPKERKIDATTLGIIGIGALVAVVLLRPEVFDRVTRLEVAGWKFEIEKKQEKQDQQLKDIQLILPILLPQEERSHLMNMASGNTRQYQGSHEVRTELRRLRSLKLIRMRADKPVADIGDGKKWILQTMSASPILASIGWRESWKSKPRKRTKRQSREQKCNGTCAARKLSRR